MTWKRSIPTAWRIVPLRRLLHGIEQGWSPVADDRQAGDGEWAVIKLSAVGPGKFSPEQHKALAVGTVPELRFEIRSGDVLLTRANTPDLVGEACVVGETRRHLMLCDLVYRLSLDRGTIDARYLSYWLGSRPGRAQVEADARGSSQSMVKVSQGHIRAWNVAFPAIIEQRAIAAFLDRKTAAIDALIEKKELLRDLVLETLRVKAADAVTKGLNPATPRRFSGVDWLGDIPTDWEVLRTRRLCSLTTGGRDTQDAEDDGPFPFFVRSDTVERIGTYSFDGEGVLTSGDGVGVGKIFHHFVGKLEFHQRVYLYYGFKRVLGRFFFYYLREHLARVALAGNAKSTVDSLRRPMLMDFPVAVPPVHEQEAIVRYLDEMFTETERQRGVLLQQLGCLREYRQALITAAVTGQIDVKQEAAA